MNKIRGFERVSCNFRKNSERKIILPTRSDSGSSGYDFYMPVNLLIFAGECSPLIFTDVRAYMQEDEELLLYIRSSLGMKGLTLANSVGKIDSSYYKNPSNDGNIGVKFFNASDENILITQGERVMQGTFSKYLLADNDKVVNKSREGGFGHSGL